MNEGNSSPTPQDLMVGMEKIKKFSRDITPSVTEAATKPDGYLDAALLFCGLGYYLEISIDVMCKGDANKRKLLVDFVCEGLRKHGNEV